MVDESVLASIRQLAEQELGLVDSDWSLESRVDEIDIDSLDVIKLALILEKRWGVKVSPAEVAKAQTVGDIVQLIARRRSSTKEPASTPHGPAQSA